MKNISAILLAAGTGSRLMPLTKFWPKCLMPIHKIPLLEFWLSDLWENDIKQAIVNTCHHGDIVSDFLSRPRFRDWVQNSREDVLLGTAGTIRKNKKTSNLKINFNKIFNIIKNNFHNKKILIGGYYPVNNEIDDIQILKEFNKRNYKTSLPVIKSNFEMDFYSWSYFESLKINKLGIPEPCKKKKIYPDVILVPLVAFDANLNRLGYGGGYYDRIIQKLENKKKILKIGLAFSFQRVKKVPIFKYDKKLDYILTEKLTLK